MSTSQVYATGQNRYSEIPDQRRNGGYSYKSVKSLTKIESLSNKNITKIMTGSYYTFFIDNNDNVWSSGSNHHGQQGFASKSLTHKSIKSPQNTMSDYFKQNDITISKICINHSGHATFCIATNNQVYASGYNLFYQLGINDTDDQHIPISIPSLKNKNVIDCKSGYRYSIALCKHMMKSRYDIVI